MSDAHAPDASTEPLFTVAEVEQLSNDDVTAGRTVGKMLTLMFLYTVLAMSLVSWWTVRSVANNHGAGADAEATTQPAHQPSGPHAAE